MSQQQAQAGSGGPMLNLPYAYFYGGNMMPGFQYGTPVYPQQMATTNATSSAQFPKPNAYNSGYGSSAYDSLNQTAQDYSKSSGYQSAGVSQQQSKGQSVNNPQQSGSGSDISSSMYGKSHVALNKVNVSMAGVGNVVESSSSSSGKMLIAILICSPTRSSRSTRAHRRRSTWPVTRQRDRRRSRTECTFRRCRLRITT